MLIHLHIAFGFHAVGAEFSSCNRDYLDHKISNIYNLTLHRKHLLTPGPEYFKWKHKVHNIQIDHLSACNILNDSL